jgi:serine/threonine protein kinase
MAPPQHSAARDKLPTVIHGAGEETAAGPQSDTVTKADFIPAKLERYKVLHKLGQGGMGWVMLAEDTQLGRRVALKVMRSQQAAEVESRERFLREARAAAQLKHDNIITIYQVGEDQGIPFLAMELLEGGTLQQRLEYPKPLSLGAAVRIAREIAAGLSAAHQRGVIHRDIKPANIWLESPKGRVKILDFGLARQADAKTAGLTQAGEIVGTPHYMAPEQARAKPIDARCDLFSLGCILYRMTTGRLPFAGDTLLATLTAIAVDMPTPVRELNPQAPEVLCDLIWRLLAKDPNQRPATAKEVIDELAAIERDVAGGSKSGFSIEVPLVIQLKTDPSPPAIAPTKKAALTGRIRPGTARKQSSLLPWVLAGATLALVLLGLLWLITWAMNSSPSSPVNGTARAPLRPKTDLRRVVALDAPSALASRNAAQWVFQQGGPSAAVEVEVAGQRGTVMVPSATLLPESPFALVGVRLSGSTTWSDPDLARLASIKSLSWIDLAGTSISDAGVRQLLDVSALTNINLDGTAVTDEGVVHLVRNCPNLNRLSIGKAKCTPAVVEAITGLKQMRDLSLAGVPLVDEQLAVICQLANLRTLNLAHTRITDVGIVHLARLTELENLRLDGTLVSDVGLATIAKDHGHLLTLGLCAMPNLTGAGLAHLANLSRLELLEIRGTPRIGDEDLAHLAVAASLRRLEVNRGQFSTAAIDNLRQALPQCEILQQDASSML